VILWLWFLIPSGLLSSKAWWIILGFLAVPVAFFSRRLISLRSYVLGSVGSVLEGTAAEHIAPRQ
jgi:hypothetical protein